MQMFPGSENCGPKSELQFKTLRSSGANFEATVLGANGSVPAIEAAAAAWAGKNIIPPDLFDAELGYFIDRYYAGGVSTAHFPHLNFRPNDHQALVENVLKRDANDPQSVAAALLIITFRYRNNLFHGLKWAYRLQDQLENFLCANSVMPKSIDLDRASKP